MGKLGNVAAGLGTVPGLSVLAEQGINLASSQNIAVGTTIEKIAEYVGNILGAGAHATHPLVLPLAGAIAAGTLSHQILNDLGIENRLARILIMLSSAVGGGALSMAGGPLVTGALAVGSAAYWVGKPLFKKVAKPLATTLGKTVSTPFVGLGGAIAGGVKGAINGTSNSVKNLWKDGKMIPSTGF